MKPKSDGERLLEALAFYSMLFFGAMTVVTTGLAVMSQDPAYVTNAKWCAVGFVLTGSAVVYEALMDWFDK